MAVYEGAGEMKGRKDSFNDTGVPRSMLDKIRRLRDDGGR